MTDTNPTAAAQLDAAREQRLAGTLSERDYFATVERLAPLAEKGQPAPAGSGDQARATADHLRQQRLQGKISDRDFFTRMDALHATDAQPGETDLSVEAQADLDRAFTPPDGPAGYRFDYGPNFEGNSKTLALDGQLRAGMHARGIPQVIANTMATTADRIARRHSRPPTEAETAKLFEPVLAELRQRWGSEYGARTAAIQKLLVSRDDVFAEVVETLPHLLADVGVMTGLDELLRHRARGAA